MLETPRSFRGMVTAPHHLAARAGLRVLEEGGNAIEAMVTAASTIAVVYPHMNALGGDNFWLLDGPGRAPLGIDACGAAAERAEVAFYRARGHDTIPTRGPLAALTVAGAVSGWQAALDFSAREWNGRLPLGRLLEDAIHYARDGIAVTRSQHANTVAKLAELKSVTGYAASYLSEGRAPAVGVRFRQPRLAATLEALARNGLDGFYRGKIAEAIAADLARVGSPLAGADLARHRARVVTPLRATVAGHEVFNLPPPTQGLASLILLAVYGRLGVAESEGFDFVHAMVEAAKCAFRIRDASITDPDYMVRDAASFLEEAALDALAAGIDRARATPWPASAPGGDTVWLAAMDSQGHSVSFIQSIYWEFGSGVVLPETGIAWQNRGTSFNLDERHHNSLLPGRRPFHTIQPALARLADGRVLAYGTMGGEGQPQTQAAIFARHVLYGQELQRAVSAPRWLLGRTWGAETTSLKLESRFDPAVVEALRGAGHNVEIVAPYDEITGHAGALLRHANGLLEGASDPRSDGAVAAF